MPKYIVTNYVDVKEVYYIRAESEEEAFDIMVDSEPNETYELSNNPEIELDDSLDEAEENDLKERSWNVDIDMDVHSFNNPPKKGKK